MPTSGHRYAWKRTVALSCYFGTERSNSVLFASKCRDRGGVSVDEGLPSICRYMCAYMCSLLQWESVGVLLFLLWRKEVECDAPAGARCCQFLLKMQDTCNTATTVSHCAYVYHRIAGIAEEPWAYRWNFLVFGWWF